MVFIEASEIRKKFLDFFQANGHAIVASSSLIPDDPSVLLTTAGMQQFKKYYTGEADPLKDFNSKNTASIQKSFRTSDIDEVGDATHQTFFEMLGNFSFGGYQKREAITLAHGLITKVFGLPISYVTVFEGSASVPKDKESKAIWNELGIMDVREEGMQDVFWGPTGSSGPCGPTTELYCKNADGNDVEIWNIVFNQFLYPGSREELFQNARGKGLEPLPVFGVDTGAGLERVAMIVQGKKSNYDTDLFLPLISLLPAGVDERTKRIMVDHIRASTFLLADGVRPSNKGAGYILRRLMRRVMVHERIREIPTHVVGALVHDVIHMYGDFYPELRREADAIRQEFDAERERFLKTFERGFKEFNDRIMTREPKDKFGRIGSFHDQKHLYGDDAFFLYQTFGFPREVMKDLSQGAGGSFDDEGFDRALKQHQEVSRAGLEKKFGGHGLLLDTGELKAKDEEELKKVTRLHTATHLLHQALRQVLGDSVHQMGSDITFERTRFDFAFDRKMTPEEIRTVENIVNAVVKRDLIVSFVELPIGEAKKTGALFFFKEKYPDRVKVYSVGDFSKEFCGGPHVTHTAEIGTFKIMKEESSSAGVRRIRATVEQ